MKERKPRRATAKQIEVRRIFGKAVKAAYADYNRTTPKKERKKRGKAYARSSEINKKIAKLEKIFGKNKSAGMTKNLLSKAKRLRELTDEAVKNLK